MLTGKLVRLRAIEPTDLERIQVWINDREVTQWLSARYPLSMAQEQRWLEGVASRPHAEGITLAIETLTEDRHIGSISLTRKSVESRNAELGIMIGDKPSWNAGHGTDAILTLLTFGFDEMNLHRIQLSVLDTNARAIACYRKCGFKEEGLLREDVYKAGRYHDMVIMSTLEQDFRTASIPTT